MSDERTIHGGGGIVSRSGERSTPRERETLADAMRAWRRRWASSVVIATSSHPDSGYRGITLSAVMPVSLEPPHLACSIAADGAFAALLHETGQCAIHILDRDQEFLAERFAGRAPLPDARFSGIPHQVREGLPLLTDALAWAIGSVAMFEPVGDQLLVLVRVTELGVGDDTDDPLLSYEGRYRGMEAS